MMRTLEEKLPQEVGYCKKNVLNSSFVKGKPSLADRRKIAGEDNPSDQLERTKNGWNYSSQL